WQVAFDTYAAVGTAHGMVFGGVEQAHGAAEACLLGVGANADTNACKQADQAVEGFLRVVPEVRHLGAAVAAEGAVGQPLLNGAVVQPPNQRRTRQNQQQSSPAYRAQAQEGGAARG